MPYIVDTLEHVAVPGKENEPLPMFQKMLRKLYEQLARVINGGISFGDGLNEISDNINGIWSNVADTGTANTDFTIVHNLGRIPNGWLSVEQDKAGIYYLGSVAATTTEITLKCDTANVAVRLFIF